MKDNANNTQSKQYRRQRYLKNKEKVAEQVKAYYEANKLRILAQRKAAYVKQRELLKKAKEQLENNAHL